MSYKGKKNCLEEGVTAEGPCRALPHLQELSVPLGHGRGEPGPYLGQSRPSSHSSGILPGAFLPSTARPAAARLGSSLPGPPRLW